MHTQENVKLSTSSKTLLELFGKPKVNFLGCEFDFRDKYLVKGLGKTYGWEESYYTGNDIDRLLANNKSFQYKRLPMYKTITDWGVFLENNKTLIVGLGCFIIGAILF
jgi:hypothetical protein